MDGQKSTSDSCQRVQNPLPAPVESPQTLRILPERYGERLYPFRWPAGERFLTGETS